MSHYKEETTRSIVGLHFLYKMQKRAAEYDIVHVHDIYKLVPKLRKRYPSKTIILHWHGTILRNTSKEKRAEAERCADEVLVSTPDLLQFTNATYLPNPIDREMFFSTKQRKTHSITKVVCFMSKMENPADLRKNLDEHGIVMDLDTVDRTTNPINYAKMPAFLQKYECLLDTKFIYGSKPGPFLSMTGLQALSVGLRVIDYEYKVRDAFPEQHDPYNVVKKLDDIYRI